MITFSKLGDYGRFGNQLWQIASGIGIASRNLDKFALYNDWQYQKYFKNPLPMMIPAYLHRITEESPYYTEYNLSREMKWDLLGYFQSWKYFKDCEVTVRHYFEFDKLPMDGVAVHVRRGDYLNLQQFYPILTPSYYMDAMKLFNGEKFTIFSNDMEWCRENLKGYNIDYFETTGDDIVDFKIMSSYDKFIIANSSYSWWAAYLSGSSKIVAPMTWDYRENRDDRIPNGWVKIW